jgi:hypothetical protein
LSKEINFGAQQNEYDFLQVHMHWGENTSRGSEHLLDGQAFAAEVAEFDFNIEFLFLFPLKKNQLFQKDSFCQLE